MIPKDQFLLLIGRMVTTVSPSETAAFSIAGPQLADALYSGEGVDSTHKQRASEFHFLDAATQVLQFVGLMIGTFNAVRGVIKTIKPSVDTAFKQKLVSEWIRDLQSAGLPDETANKIATQFGEELAAAMNR